MADHHHRLNFVGKRTQQPEELGLAGSVELLVEPGFDLMAKGGPKAREGLTGPPRRRAQHEIGRIPSASRWAAITLAARLPRPASGRSRSASDRSFQLDLA